jgi:hypothetical protein
MSLNPQFAIVVRQLLKGPVRNFYLTEDHSVLSPTKVLSELVEMGFQLSKRWVPFDHPRTGKKHKVLEYALVRDWEGLSANGKSVLAKARRVEH